MSDLTDAFGEDFAKGVRKTKQEKQRERSRVTEGEMALICKEAIENNRFDEGNPTFQYTTDNGITHDVMLVQVPDPQRGEVWEHLSEPWDGAAKLPLDYMGEWYWTTFPNKDDVKKFDQGDWCIAVGAIEENEGENGEVYKSIYPCRGIETTEEAAEIAKTADEDEFIEDVKEESEDEEDEPDLPDEDDIIEEDEETEEDPEPEEDEVEEEDETDEEPETDEEESSGGLSNLLEEEEAEDEPEEEEEEPDPVSYEEVAEFLEQTIEVQDEGEDPQVVDITRDHPASDRLVSMACDALAVDNEEGVAEVVFDVLEEKREDDEEEEEELTSNKLFEA